MICLKINHPYVISLLTILQWLFIKTKALQDLHTTPLYLLCDPGILHPMHTSCCSWPSFHTENFVVVPSAWNGLPPFIPLANFLIFKSLLISQLAHPHPSCSLFPSCSLPPLLCSGISVFQSMYHFLIHYFLILLFIFH